jgi:hypothetical protein
MTVTIQGYFSRTCNFLLFMSAQVFVNEQNPPKITLHSKLSYHSPPNVYKGSKGATLKVMGKAILFYQINYLINVSLWS